jgi:hypothetical protein
MCDYIANVLITNIQARKWNAVPPQKLYLPLMETILVSLGKH